MDADFLIIHSRVHNIPYQYAVVGQNFKVFLCSPQRRTLQLTFPLPLQEYREGGHQQWRSHVGRGLEGTHTFLNIFCKFS